MLDSTTMALRAALLVRNGFANANGYSYSIGSIGSMVIKNGNQISYIKGSVGTLRTQPNSRYDISDYVIAPNHRPIAGPSGDQVRERIEASIRYNANKPIGTLSEKVIVETGEQTASGSATQKALEIASGVRLDYNKSAQEESFMLSEEPINDFPIDTDSPTTPTQRQAQASFFERNKTTILIAVVLIVVAALFLWKK